MRRPLPSHCPHCGAFIRGVRPRGIPQLLALLLVLAMFGLLVVFLGWMLGAL